MFTVAFDFEGRAMYLQPNRNFGQRQAFDASGAAFRPGADGYRVDVVLPESPAARAGLREGDRLLDVDGRAPQTFTPVQLRDYLSRPGEMCILRVVRNGETLRLTLRLEDRL
jgi:S1-C subfamily serine protease